jgi:hypothetical protein
MVANRFFGKPNAAKWSGVGRAKTYYHTVIDSFNAVRGAVGIEVLFIDDRGKKFYLKTRWTAVTKNGVISLNYLK